MAPGWLVLKFRHESVRGTPLDEIKSALQKYVRLGDFSKAIRCALDWHHVCWAVYGPPDDAYAGAPEEGAKEEAAKFREDWVRRGKSLFTNLINRLITVYLEDVAPAAPGLMQDVNEYAGQMRRLRRAMDSRDGWDEREFLSACCGSMEAMTKWVDRMARAQKSRSCSHFNAVFWKPTVLAAAGGGKKSAEREHRQHHRLATQFYAESIGAMYSKGILAKPGPSGRSSSKSVSSHFGRFLRHAKKQDNRAVVDAARMLCASDFGAFVRNLALNSSRRELVLDADTLNVARAWHGSLPKASRHLVPIYLVLLSMRLVGSSLPEEHTVSWRYLVETVLKERPLHIPECAVDKHTARGRQAGSDGARFVLEGARVENESPCVVPLFKRFYEDLGVMRAINCWEDFVTWKRQRDAEQCPPPSTSISSSSSTSSSSRTKRSTPDSEEEGDRRHKKQKQKEEEEEEEEEKEEDSSRKMPRESQKVVGPLVRAQLITSKSRPDTYFARLASTGKDVLVKGPYLPRSAANTAITFEQVKQHIAQELPATPRQVELWVPDAPLDSPMGTRTKMTEQQLRRAHPFMVSDDLVGFRRVGTVTRSSKAWPPTEVVDWDAMRREHGAGRLADPKDLDPRASRDLVLSLLFRYIFGVPDFSPRNFVHGRDGRIYSVDEENAFALDDDRMRNCIRAELRRFLVAELRRQPEWLRPTLQAWRDRLFGRHAPRNIDFMVKTLRPMISDGMERLRKNFFNLLRPGDLCCAHLIHLLEGEKR